MTVSSATAFDPRRPRVFLVCLTLGHTWAVGNLIESPGYGGTVRRVPSATAAGSATTSATGYLSVDSIQVEPE